MYSFAYSFLPTENLVVDSIAMVYTQTIDGVGKMWYFSKTLLSFFGRINIASCLAATIRATRSTIR